MWRSQWGLRGLSISAASAAALTQRQIVIVVGAVLVCHLAKRGDPGLSYLLPTIDQLTVVTSRHSWHCGEGTKIPSLAFRDSGPATRTRMEVNWEYGSISHTGPPNGG